MSENNALARINLEHQIELEEMYADHDDEMERSKNEHELNLYRLKKLHQEKMLLLKQQEDEVENDIEDLNENFKIDKENQQKTHELKMKQIGTTYGNYWYQNGAPKYCIHGNLWSHCFSGPPKYCVHGSVFGSHCLSPN